MIAKMTENSKTAIIWTRTNCPACTRAKKLLDSKQIPWIEKKLNSVSNQRQFALQTKGAKSVPQIFIGEVYIGGFDSLEKYSKRGDLDKILGRISKKRNFFHWFIGR